MKILVLGSKGQIGRCLKDQLTNSNHEVIYMSREHLDIADLDRTKMKILDISCDLIINASAYTKVDMAEEDKDMANLINCLAVKNLAEICNQQDCFLIHISTDYVFDGNSKTPYKEDDKTNPQCVYGESKLNGELAIQFSGCKHIIIRTAWVFSEYGNNFLKKILHNGAEKNELSIVNDQIGCPTYAQDIAIAIVTIISKLNSIKGVNGIYHFCGDSPCSWFEFAKEIFKQINKHNQISIPKIKAVSSEEFPTRAKRPKFSVLDNRKLQEKFNIFSSDWRSGVGSVIQKVAKNV